MNILNENEDSARDLLICNFPESDDDSSPEDKNKSLFRTLNEDLTGEIQKNP